MPKTMIGTVHGLLYGLGSTTVHINAVCASVRSLQSHNRPEAIADVNERLAISTGSMMSVEAVTSSMTAIVFGLAE
jgi:ethanolamine ammonia-lyase large subunit